MAEEQISVVLKANIDNYNKNMSIAAGVLKDLQKQSAEFMKINNGVEDSFTKIEFAAKRFGETAGVLEKKLVVIKKAMTDLVVAGQANTKAFKDLDNQYRIITNRLENKAMAEAQAYAQANMTNIALPKTAKNLDQLGQSVKKNNMQWTSLALVIQDLPFGFRAIQNNLPALVGSFAAATGPIYLGFSALIAITTAYEKEIAQLIYGINDLSIANKKMNETLATNIGQAKSQIASDQSLLKIINDTTKSTDERKRALTTLKEEYKGNIELQKLDIEDGTKLTEVYNKISNALLRRAKATAYASLIAEEEAKIFKLQNQQGEEVVKNLGFMSTVYGLATGGALGFNSAANVVSSAFSKQAKEIKQSQLNIEFYTKKLDENTEAANKNADAQSLDTTATKDKGAAARKKAAALAKKEAEKLALYVSKRLAGAGGETTYVGEPSLDPNAQAKAFAEKMAFDKKMSKERVDFIKQQYEIEVSEAEGSFDKIKIAEENMRIALNQGFMDNSIKLSEYIDAITELRKKSNKTITDEANAQMQQTLKIGIGIMNALGPALDLLLEKGASIGEVLSQAFSDVIKKLVKVAIAAAVAVAIMSMIPGLIQPGKGLATFGNLIGQGMGLGANLFGAKPTANGGIFGGPSYRLVGEYPGAQSNPEVVAPLDKLKDMIGGAGGGTLEARISGSDLLILMNKAQRNNNTTF